MGSVPAPCERRIAITGAACMKLAGLVEQYVTLDRHLPVVLPLQADQSLADVQQGRIDRRAAPPPRQHIGGAKTSMVTLSVSGTA
jgi:hypothetical protein